MGIQQVLSAPRAPWQRAHVERVIGTIRRECLDHMIVFNESSLYRHLQGFLVYYHQSRTHLGLWRCASSLRAPRRRKPATSVDFSYGLLTPSFGGSLDGDRAHTQSDSEETHGQNNTQLRPAGA